MSIPFAHKFQKRLKKIFFLWFFCITFLHYYQSIYKNITYLRSFFGKTLQHFTAFPVFRHIVTSSRKRRVPDTEILAALPHPLQKKEPELPLSGRFPILLYHTLIYNSLLTKMEIIALVPCALFRRQSVPFCSPALHLQIFHPRPPPQDRPP